MCIYDESANHPPPPDRTVPLPGVCAVSWSDEVRYPLATPITPLPSPELWLRGVRCRGAKEKITGTQIGVRDGVLVGPLLVCKQKTAFGSTVV